MGMARSTYYAVPAPRGDDALLVAAIKAICDAFESYGWRRVQVALRHQGIIANHKRVKRVMREHGLQPRRRRRRVTTTDSDHDEPIFPDRSRDVALDGPNQLWVADLTYVALLEGFAYVAIILDDECPHCAIPRNGDDSPRLVGGVCQRRVHLISVWQ